MASSHRKGGKWLVAIENLQVEFEDYFARLDLEEGQPFDQRAAVSFAVFHDVTQPHFSAP